MLLYQLNITAVGRFVLLVSVLSQAFWFG